jgi:hypothetical protein
MSATVRLYEINRKNGGWAVVSSHLAPGPSASVLAFGSHAPLEIALPIIAAVVIVKVVVAKLKGRPPLGGNIVARCSKGHVFTTTWSSLGSLSSVRLGTARFQRCPVGHHWALFKPVNDADLTDEDRRAVQQNRG